MCFRSLYGKYFCKRKIRIRLNISYHLYSSRKSLVWWEWQRPLSLECSRRWRRPPMSTVISCSGAWSRSVLKSVNERCRQWKGRLMMISRHDHVDDKSVAFQSDRNCSTNKSDSHKDKCINLFFVKI